LEKSQDRRLTLGRGGEDTAAAYLVANRYRIQARGFRFGRGEIDIVAWDRETLVFVEVKTRAGERFGSPEESVTTSKQRQIRRLAEGFLMRFRIPSDTPCRFDVISLGRDAGGAPEIRHLKDAF
jgi:putative endonuclease